MPMPRHATTPSVQDKTKYIYNRLIQAGYTAEQSAGIIGNLLQESQLNTEAESKDGHNSKGIAQWTGERIKNKDKWLKDNNLQNDLKGQTEFLIYELSNKYAQTNNKLKRSKTVEDATQIFNRYYEVSADSRNINSTPAQKRFSYALSTYKAMTGKDATRGFTINVHRNKKQELDFVDDEVGIYYDYLTSTLGLSSQEASGIAGGLGALAMENGTSLYKLLQQNPNKEQSYKEVFHDNFNLQLGKREGDSKSVLDIIREVGKGKDATYIAGLTKTIYKDPNTPISDLTSDTSLLDGALFAKRIYENKTGTRDNYAFSPLLDANPNAIVIGNHTLTNQGQQNTNSYAATSNTPSNTSFTPTLQYIGGVVTPPTSYENITGDPGAIEVANLEYQMKRDSEMKATLDSIAKSLYEQNLKADKEAEATALATAEAKKQQELQAKINQQNFIASVFMAYGGFTPVDRDGGQNRYQVVDTHNDLLGLIASQQQLQQS